MDGNTDGTNNVKQAGCTKDGKKDWDRTKNVNKDKDINVEEFLSLLDTMFEKQAWADLL